MKMFKIVAAVAVAALTTLPAMAQDWPNGPVQLIVPSRPGGGTDVMARIFSDYLQKEIGSPVVVVDQPAGSGTVAFEQVRTAKPDGQTLLFYHSSLIVNYFTGQYDHPQSEFTTIGIAQSYPPQVYATGPNASWADLKAFVEDARVHPGERTVGVSLGGTSHFIAGLLMMNEGIDLKLVDAAAEVDKVAALQGGFIDLGNMGAGSARQYVEAGDMKVLSLIDPTPYPKYPEFKTALEEGVNMSWISPLIVWGPPGMDPALAQKINAAFANFATDPTAMDQLDKADSSFAYYDLDKTKEILAGEEEKIGGIAAKLGLSVR